MLRYEIQPCFFQSTPVYVHTTTRHCHATALPVARWVWSSSGSPGMIKFDQRSRGTSHEMNREKMKVKMGNFEIARFVLLILLFSITFSKADNFEKRKNVLVMIADDFGLQTQVYNNTVCKTPNLNALAKRSVTFRNGFTSVSSCSPSRSAILTGEKIRSASDTSVRKYLH